MVTIFGGIADAHIAVLEWMLDTAATGEIFKRIEKLPFSSYAAVLDSAEIFVIPRLAADVTTRMERIAQGQIPSDDAKVIYDRYKQPHKYRWAIAENIAKVIWHGDMKYPKRFEKVFQEKPEIKDDVDICLVDLEVRDEGEANWEQREIDTHEGRTPKGKPISLKGQGAARWAAMVANIQRD